MVSRAHIPLAFFGLPPAAQKPAQDLSVIVVNKFQEIYIQIKPNIDGKRSQVALAHDKREMSNALVKKVENLQSQIETASVEFDKIMADNASKMSQIHALEVKIRDFEIHLDATKIETAGLNTQVAAMKSEK
ncbi:hypothetical protein ACHAO8_002165 [Botrytis cinerea]